MDLHRVVGRLSFLPSIPRLEDTWWRNRSLGPSPGLTRGRASGRRAYWSNWRLRVGARGAVGGSVGVVAAGRERGGAAGRRSRSGLVFLGWWQNPESCCALRLSLCGGWRRGRRICSVPLAGCAISAVRLAKSCLRARAVGSQVGSHAFRPRRPRPYTRMAISALLARLAGASGRGGQFSPICLSFELVGWGNSCPRRGREEHLWSTPVSVWQRERCP